ncbi:MAG: hypothetical protein LC797_23740 [Chloroflexi bacterium]|nr:hypothetical protein [Chloroflexota bacterium]
MVLVLVVSCLLMLLAADRVARGLAAIKHPVEAMYGESIIYDQATRFVRGEALYQPLDQSPFSVAAYTPLYYAAVAGLREVGLSGFGPGRVASFLAALAAAILVAQLARRRAGDMRAGLFAALMFLALGFPGDFPWFAFYKEDMLGVALSLGAIAVLDTGTDRRHAVCAGALAGLAFLTKQTFLAASVAGFAWLLFRHRARAAAFAITILIVAGGPCLWLALSSGAFVDNTIRANLNPSGAAILLTNLDIFERYQGAALVLALLPLLSRTVPWRLWLRDPLVLLWLMSLALLPVGLAKVGSNWNYWIDSAAATAVLATSAVWTLGLRAGVGDGFGRIATSAGLVAMLGTPLWLPKPAADLGAVVDRTLHPDQRQSTEFAAVIDRVRSEPRGVLAEPLDILTLAGREILFEPYIFSILHRQGRWDARPAVRQICTGQIGLLVLDHALQDPPWEYHGYSHWPAPVLDALRAVMRQEKMQARLFLYTPAPIPSGAPSPPACRGFT